MPDLARRLVALPEWEWWDGMHADDGRRYLASGWVADPGAIPTTWSPMPVPDLHDPATVGWLLDWASRLGAVALEGADDLGWTARITPPGSYPGHPRQRGATPGEALARAILAALETT